MKPAFIAALLGFLFSQRGKTVPEELVKPEELSKYRQVASHVVSTWRWPLLFLGHSGPAGGAGGNAAQTSGMVSCHAVRELLHPGSQPSWVDKG